MSGADAVMEKAETPGLCFFFEWPARHHHSSRLTGLRASLLALAQSRRVK